MTKNATTAVSFIFPFKMFLSFLVLPSIGSKKSYVKSAVAKLKVFTR
jgi:hypothetical protein